MVELGLYAFLAGFYIIKGVLNEKGIISDECNQCMNDIVTDTFSSDYWDD